MIVMMTLHCPDCGLEYRTGHSTHEPFLCPECGRELYTPVHMGDLKNLKSVIEAALRKGVEIRIEHLESMAAAYFQKTGIPPDEVELVEDVQGWKRVWYFRRREAP